MKSIKDWISSHSSFPLLVSLRSPSYNSGIEASQSEGISLNGGRENDRDPLKKEASLERHASGGSCPQSLHAVTPVSEVERLQVDFIRIIRRLGQPLDDPMVSTVLHRLHITNLIRQGTTLTGALERSASGRETTGFMKTDLHVKVLVIGKTGVGKSATINSIFGRSVASTDAFRPSTDRVQDITGTLHGLTVTMIDTPGLRPFSTSTMNVNRRILTSIRRHVRWSPPELVLYVDRPDLTGHDGGRDAGLMSLITELLGPSIWFHAAIVLTHSASPTAPHLQRAIHHAASDSRLQNPVVSVDNQTPDDREPWRTGFLSLCVCSKVLAEANALSGFRTELGPVRLRRRKTVSAPHALSSLLHRSEGEEEKEEEDVYDQLPPIRILSNREFEKLPREQKAAYLDELDYREKLYAVKQRRETKATASEPLLLPDMVVPEGFGSDCPSYRYRCLQESGMWVVRPVLDTHGWDSDVGFDGIGLELDAEAFPTVRARGALQVSKDKMGITLRSECSATYLRMCSIGLDVQSSDGDTLCGVHGSARSPWLGCGVSVCPGSCVGVKVEHTIPFGRATKVGAGVGRVFGSADGPTCGVVARLAVQDGFSVAVVALASETGRQVTNGTLVSEFRLLRGAQVSLNVDVYRKRPGQVGLKISGSRCVGGASFVVVFAVLRYLFRKKDVSRLASSL